LIQDFLFLFLEEEINGSLPHAGLEVTDMGIGNLESLVQFVRALWWEELKSRGRVRGVGSGDEVLCGGHLE
jgi:hypothetical protein